MYVAYLFSVVLGGGLLLLSLLGDLLGGDASDLELDVDFDSTSDVDHSATKILSFRMVSYALFGFGAVGWLLTQAGFVPGAASTVTYASSAGILSGALVQRVFAYLRRTETGMLQPDDSFAGLSGQVILPLGGGTAGGVAVERGGRRLTLRALPHSTASASRPPEDWKDVVVVEMKDGIAYVVPTDRDLTALP
jgi:hypothetical protein